MTAPGGLRVVSHSLPLPEVFLNAIDIYLEHAYHGPPPSAVRLRIETLRAMPSNEFYECAVLEHEVCRQPDRYFLRLGNQTYPHMKLALYRPAAGRWAFAVEEHDQVGTPSPGSREYRFFAQMVAHNRDLAVEIEQYWTSAGLPVHPRTMINNVPAARV